MIRRFRFPHPRLKLAVLWTLHIAIALYAAKGFVWFVWQPAVFVWGCWRLNALPGVYCEVGSLTWAVLAGTLAVDGLIAWRVYRFARSNWPGRS